MSANMAYDGYSNKSLLSISGNRESCKHCNKFVYFHQPILFCKKCRSVFHGTCLKLTNDLVFILQQINWICIECSNTLDRHYNCVSCKLEILIYYDKFNVCQLCRKLSHLQCLNDKVCDECFTYSDVISNFNCNMTVTSPIDKQNLDQSNFYNSLPIFSPFEFYEKNIMEFIPDVDGLSEQLSDCSMILNSCCYLNQEDYKQIRNSDNFSTSLVGVNIDGVRTNFDKFKIFSRDLDKVLGYFICESNVTEYESQIFFLEGYNKFVLDRIVKQDNNLKHKGSGLITFINHCFKNVKIYSDMCVSSLDFECLTLELITGKSKYLLINVYRSPSGNFETFLKYFENILELANKRKKFITYILGDFNINLYNPNNWRCKDYLACIFSNGFLPLISRATHFVSDRPTLIDHILCNDTSELFSSLIFKAKISHHFPVCLNLNLDLPELIHERSKPRVRINEYLLKNFICELKHIDNAINLNLSAEKCFTEFFDKFKNSYDKWFVQTNDSNFRNSNNLRKDWITIGLAKSCLNRKKLYENWISNRNISNWNSYSKYSRKLDFLLDKTKFDYFSKKIEENKDDLKRTWRLINNILGRKRQNKLLTFPEADAAHSFNKYFVNVASDLLHTTYSTSESISEDNDMMGFLPEVNIEETFDNLEINQSDIEFFIAKLGNSKGSYFAPKILKQVSYNLSPLLCKLFNKCIREGYFPKELKIAKVIPLFKNKGDISDIGNYRPISMLSAFSKVFEKVLHKSIVDHLDKYDILNDSQYGFRKKRSTLHALLNATENIYEALDSKLHTLGIFIDFSRAFDTIDHELLLKKLSHYGIRGNILNILRSYLTNRKQYVSYGGIDSTLLNIVCGVPQGSVLGPLLFIIFINDITSISNEASFILFADDLNLFITHTCRTTLYRHANQILYNLYKYCVANRLILNFSKCCFIEFGHKEVNNDIFLGILNNRFKKVDSCKFLGVVINRKLNWNAHIDHVISQVSKSCGTLYRVRLHVPRKILKNIYMALIQPYLIYCISLWGYSLKSATMNKLFVLQKKCVRIITGKTTKENGIFQHTKPMFYNLKILNIFNLYTYFTAVEGMKILRNRSPKHIMNKFKISVHSFRLIYPKFKVESLKMKSFMFNSSKILNYLLVNNVPYFDIISENTFKSRLKSHLLYLQGQCRAGDMEWLPCNHDIFSDVLF